jgi:hypothetical protein
MATEAVAVVEGQMPLAVVAVLGLLVRGAMQLRRQVALRA